MILPRIEAGALHAERRVTAFSGLKSMSVLTTAALIIRNAGRNGIIRLTIMA
jgi:hypothetical protein